MNRFNAQIHIVYNKQGTEMKMVFISKRLAKLIYKKSKSGEWVYTYFPVSIIFLYGEFILKMVGTNGSLLLTVSSAKIWVKKATILRSSGDK